MQLLYVSEGELKLKNLTGSQSWLFLLGASTARQDKKSRVFRAAGHAGSRSGQSSTGAQVLTALYTAFVQPTIAQNSGSHALEEQLPSY